MFNINNLQKHMEDNKSGLDIAEIVKISIGMICVSVIFIMNFLEEESIRQRIYMGILYIILWIAIIFMCKKSK